jgi:hypothetical protein
MTSSTGNTKDNANHQESAVGDLAGRLSDLVTELQREQETEAFPTDVVHAALDLIPHVAEASVNLVTGRRIVQSRAASGELLGGSVPCKVPPARPHVRLL